MDYIFTISFNVGIPVSSLYGAPILCFFVYGVPSVFAYLGALLGTPSNDLAFTDIPESFNPPFEGKAARLQADALTS